MNKKKRKKQSYLPAVVKNSDQFLAITLNSSKPLRTQLSYMQTAYFRNQPGDFIILWKYLRVWYLDLYKQS